MRSEIQPSRQFSIQRSLRTFFLALSFLMILGLSLIVIDLKGVGLAPSRSFVFWLLAFASLVFAWVGWKASETTRQGVFVLLGSVIFLEIMLQACGWAGVLPAINTKERLPWGRVYWTREGFGNSIRNRHGWHFPGFDLTRTNRIAIIGDSFVEAVEVSRNSNFAALLRKEIERESPSSTVLSLGEHGRGPAHYLEILKYAHQSFQVKEAVWLIYLGNDITDSGQTFKTQDPKSFLYYSLSNHVAILDSAAEAKRISYSRHIQATHRPFVIFLPRLLASHSMLLQIPRSVLQTVALRRRLESAQTERRDDEQYVPTLGVTLAPFDVPSSPATQEAMSILKALIAEANSFATSNQIKFSFATVPLFPPEFYGSSNWTGRIGRYDFLGPERELAVWASSHGIPMLPLGQTMKDQNLTTGDIRKLYLSNGSGHFSPEGHQFAAAALKLAFFPSNR